MCVCMTQASATRLTVRGISSLSVESQEQQNPSFVHATWYIQINRGGDTHSRVVVPKHTTKVLRMILLITSYDYSYMLVLHTISLSLSPSLTLAKWLKLLYTRLSTTTVDREESVCSPVASFKDSLCPRESVWNSLRVAAVDDSKLGH